MKKQEKQYFHKIQFAFDIYDEESDVLWHTLTRTGLEANRIKFGKVFCCFELIKVVLTIR